MLLEGHAPDLARLPDLLMALARDVEWEEERECFRTLAGVGAAGARAWRGWAALHACYATCLVHV